MRRAAKFITDWEWLILLFLIPLLLFPTGWRGLLLLIIPLLWVIRKAATGHFVPPTPLDISIFLMLIALLLSLAAVFDMQSSFPKIAGLIIGIAFYYGAVQYTRTYSNGVYHLLGLILISGTGMTVLASLSNFQTQTLTIFNLLFVRFPIPFFTLPIFNATEVNFNEIAGIIGWYFPLLLVTFVGFWREMWQSGRWSLRFAHIALLFILLISIFLHLSTRSRGGIASVILAILLVIAIRYQWGRWFLLTLGIVAVALSYLDFGVLMVGESQATDFGLEGRLEIWSRGLYGLADFPITGMGLNGFRQVVHILYPLFTISPDFDLGHAHNHLLQAGLDLGIFGLIAYLAIWLVCLAMIWKGWKHAQRHSDRVLIAGLCGSLAAGWFFGVFDAIALGARPGFLWWLLVGLLVSTFDNIWSQLRSSNRR